MSQDQLNELSTIIINCLRTLATEDGISASGKNEVFGCIFGRDSFITILKILHAIKNKPDLEFISICQRSLLTHIQLQGKEHNIESGEQPGKFIHEYRVSNYDRLTKQLQIPWYVYPDKKLRNYDSLDSTPLALIALHRFWKQTHDDNFLLRILPSVEQGLNWIITYGDMDKDTLLEYELPKKRKHGGLKVQSWTDSIFSLMDKDGHFPPYPIAPVEVQGFAWLALRLWGDFYTSTYAEKNSSRFGYKLLLHAKKMKEIFNELYIMKSGKTVYLAQALDGDKQQIKTITANPLMCLWAAYISDNVTESIIDDDYIPAIIDRAFAADMFVPHAGIRTMSSLSPTFNPDESSYHNGSFWPMLNGLIIEGLENFSYKLQSDKLRRAMLLPINHFRSPIEVYIEKNGSYYLYKNERGQQSCINQAWSAAAAYDILTGSCKPLT